MVVGVQVVGIMGAIDESEMALGGDVAMVTYLIRRFLLALLTIWVISVLSFVIIQIPPGDTADEAIRDLVERRGFMTPEQAKQLRSSMGLNLPIHSRYVKWMWDLMHLDLGVTFYMNPGYITPIPVQDIIGERGGLVCLNSAARFDKWNRAAVR